MVICPDCGKDVKEAKFCSNCGARLPDADELVVEPTIEEPIEEVPIVDEVVVPTIEDPVVEEPIDEPPVEDEVVEGEPVEDSADDEVDVNDKKTKFCPNCGVEVALETAFCPNCGFKLIQDEKSQTKFCQSCGKRIDINAEVCPHCGVRVANINNNNYYSGEKSTLLAAILSFLFPGLGHLYLGLTKKGISFIIAYIVSAILVFILIGFVLMLIVWLWALVDSIKSTEAINRGEFVEDKLF